jgi:hypothetical protein
MSTLRPGMASDIVANWLHRSLQNKAWNGAMSCAVVPTEKKKNRDWVSHSVCKLLYCNFPVVLGIRDVQLDFILQLKYIGTI